MYDLSFPMKKAGNNFDSFIWKLPLCIVLTKIKILKISTEKLI